VASRCQPFAHQTPEFSVISGASAMALPLPLQVGSDAARKRRWTMSSRWLAVVLVLIAANTAGATPRDDRKDFQGLKDVAASVDRYTKFTIFDDVNAAVKDGVVTLTGKVTMPYKRDEIAQRVAKVDGVRGVQDRIEVLPVSQFDDELRYRIARSIYGHANF